MAMMDAGMFDNEDKTPGAEHIRTLQRLQDYTNALAERSKNESINNVVRCLMLFYWGKVEGDLDAYYLRMSDIISDFLSLEYNSLQHYWRLIPNLKDYTVIEIFETEPNVYSRPVATITIPHASYKDDGLIRHLYAQATIAVTESLSDHVARVDAAKMRAHNGGR